MNASVFKIMSFIVLWALFTAAAVIAQALPGSLSFTTSGTFVNGTPESSDSILIIDNNLANGYKSGFDTIDTPDSLNPTGPTGSAAFQWGTAASASATATYLHPSALWFEPINANNVAPEQSFEMGYLFYRNGTIKTNTGASSVEMALAFAFAPSLGIDPISVILGSQLINTKNTTNQVESADIVSLRDNVTSLDFLDTYGNRYFLELTFQVDQDTLDGTLSSQDEFRVFEGQSGRAVLLGRFTTTPVGMDITLIPEPSSALLAVIGAMFLLRRKR